MYIQIQSYKNMDTTLKQKELYYLKISITQILK